MAKTPFKFLDSYTSEDRDIFFGREREVEELYYKTFDSNLLLVYGSSGTGKTSLIQCGLAGKFQDADWMPVLIRRGANINDSLRKALVGLSLVPLSEKNSLSQNIKSVYLDYFKPVYLLFDQFEELFIFGSDAEMEQFVKALHEALGSGLSCKFIFVIRGEYLEHIARFEDQIPDFFNNRIHIERMTRANAKRVITEPAGLFNLEVADNFPEKVLERLGSEKSAVELTYLQVYLDKLYKEAVIADPLHPVFNEALLERTGQITDVLSEFLDEQITKTKSPEDTLTILKSFVSDEGTKKQMSLNEIMDFTRSLGKSLSQEVVESELRQFVDLRILKEMDDNGKYELRHDALAAKIYDQISWVEKQLLEVRHFIINRYNDFQKRAILLGDADLQYLAPFENKLFLNPEQKQFIDKSKRTVRRKRNRRRNVALGASLALIIILSGFTIFSIRQRNEAMIQTEIASQKTQEALNQKDLAEKSNELALLSSKQAVEAKLYAEQQSKIAGEQKIIAEQEALKASEQSEFAIAQQQIALQEKQVAEQKTREAEVQRQKADSAQSEANRLRQLALSQALAFQSLQATNDKQLAALLACESYLLSEANGGNTQDPELYSALYENLKKMDAGFQPIIIQARKEVKTIAFDNEGKSIAVLCIDGSLSRYSSTEYSLQKTLQIPGNNMMLNTGYLCQHGKLALAAYEDHSILFYDSEKQIVSPRLTGHRGLVRDAAFSHDESLFATGGRDSTVIVWSQNTALQKYPFETRIKSLGMSNDKNTLAVGTEDGKMYLQHIPSSSKKLIGNNGPARIQSGTYSTNGNFLGFGSSDGKIHLYNHKGDLVKILTDNTNSVDFIAIDETLNVLVSVSGNRSIYVYNLANLALKPIVIKDINRQVLALTLSPDGKVFVACADNAIRQFDLKTEHLSTLLLNEITRNFTTEEWNTYIGSNEPYKKLKPELQ